MSKICHNALFEINIARVQNDLSSLTLICPPWQVMEGQNIAILFLSEESRAVECSGGVMRKNVEMVDSYSDDPRSVRLSDIREVS